MLRTLSALHRSFNLGITVISLLTKCRSDENSSNSSLRRAYANEPVVPSLREHQPPQRDPRLTLPQLTEISRCAATLNSWCETLTYFVKHGRSNASPERVVTHGYQLFVVVRCGRSEQVVEATLSRSIWSVHNIRSLSFDLSVPPYPLSAHPGNTVS